MGKFTFLILFILSSFYLCCVFAYRKCDKTTDVHCTYFIGDKSKKNGRYIKSTLMTKGISHIRCTSGDLSDIIPKAFNGWRSGKVKFKYDQCFNAECKESKSLALDEFTIIRNSKKFTSYPHTSQIRMISNYGKPCVVS